MFTSALLLLANHVPPSTVLDSDAVVPAHMLVTPVIVPALGDVFTVTRWVAAINPQLLVFE